MAFEASGYKCELVPHFEVLGNSGLVGFSLVVHRKTNVTLPYLCAKSLLKHQETIMVRSNDVKAASEQRRLLLTEIGNTLSLKETVILLSEYLQSIFSLSKHEVVQSFSRNDVQRLIVDQRLPQEKDPEILKSNFGEYFESQEKKKRLRQRLREAVFIKVMNKRELNRSKKIIRPLDSSSKLLIKSVDTSPGLKRKVGLASTKSQGM